MDDSMSKNTQGFACETLSVESSNCRRVLLPYDAANQGPGSFLVTMGDQACSGGREMSMEIVGSARSTQESRSI